MPKEMNWQDVCKIQAETINELSKLWGDALSKLENDKQLISEHVETIKQLTVERDQALCLADGLKATISELEGKIEHLKEENYMSLARAEYHRELMKAMARDYHNNG